jgi:hypothetical protein
MFSMLLATGITALLALQALLNAGVALAIAPATGITLPFISYGGSSLLTVMAAVGILLSISRGAPADAPSSSNPQSAYARFNFGWGNGGSRVSGARGSVPSQRGRSSASGPPTPRSNRRT